MREAREAMNDRTMVEFPGGDVGDVTRADGSVWASYQRAMVQQSLAEAAAHAMPVPNRIANLQAEIARLKAELAAVKAAPAADVAPAGKPPIPARTLRQPGLQRIGLLVGPV